VLVFHSRCALFLLFLFQREKAEDAAEQAEEGLRPSMTLSSCLVNAGFHAPTRLMLVYYQDFIHLPCYNIRTQFWQQSYLVQNKKKELEVYNFVVAYLPEKSTSAVANWKLEEKVCIQFPEPQGSALQPRFTCLEAEVPVKQLIPYPGAPYINAQVYVQGYKNRSLKNRKRKTDRKSTSFASAVKDGTAAASQQPAAGSAEDEHAGVQATYQPKQLLFVHAFILRFYENGNFQRWDYVLRFGESKVSGTPLSFEWTRAAAAKIFFNEGEIVSEVDVHQHFKIGSCLWVVYEEKVHAAIVLGTNLDKTTKVTMVEYDVSPADPSLAAGEGVEKQVLVRDLDLSMLVVGESIFTVTE